MLIGHARISTDDQNLELQRDALTLAGCSKQYEDKESGAKAESPGLITALEMLREGDTLVVLAAGSAGPLPQRPDCQVDKLEKRGVALKACTRTSTPPAAAANWCFICLAPWRSSSVT
nr:recombinase family protein [Candidatus Methylospira mobilis]